MKDNLLKILKKEILVWLLLGLFILLHLYLVHKTFLLDDEGNMKVAIAGFGDIPFHMTQVSHFAYGNIFDFNEPLFSGERIRYSFLINFVSGILLRITGSWAFALHFPSMIFLTASYIFLFLAIRHLTGKDWAALTGVILFMYGSGIRGWDFVKDNLLNTSYNLRQFVDYLVEHKVSTVTYWEAVYPRQNIDWGAAIGLVFMHQRAFFVGLFLFSLVIYALARFPDLDNKNWRLIAGIAFGLGPLGHYHTFLTLSVVIGIYFIISLLRRNMVLAKNLLYLALIAFVIALPQVVYLSGGKSPLDSAKQSFINFRFGWMAEPTIGSVKFPEGVEISTPQKFLVYLNFLWVNFGFILPIFLLAIFFKPVRDMNNKFPFLWFAIGLFAFVQTVRTQPWDYDTNKILVYFNFFTSIGIIMLLKLAVDNWRIWGKFITIAIVAVVVFSGFIDILPRLFVPVEKMPSIFNRDAIETAYFIRQNTEPSNIVLASSTHLNIVSSLSGRPTVVGFPGWLWTKGVDYGSRENDLKKFYEDPLANRDILSKYNAKYILIDPTTTYDWKADQNIFDQNFKFLFHSGGYTLYSAQ